jgi:cysteine sulfinate desulfinase/cysteine desulfurase-like protein
MKQAVYLDHNAATPVAPEVAVAMPIRSIRRRSLRQME